MLIGLFAASWIFLLWFCVAYYSIAMLDGRSHEEIMTFIGIAFTVWLGYVFVVVTRHA